MIVIILEKVEVVILEKVSYIFGQQHGITMSYHGRHNYHSVTM